MLPTDPDALSGRGLQLVEVAADAWGCHPVDGTDGPGSGKVVWFALHRSAPLP